MIIPRPTHKTTTTTKRKLFLDFYCSILSILIDYERMMSASNIVQAQEDDLKRPRGERIPFQQLDDNSNNIVTTNQRYAGAKKNMDHHSSHQYRHRDEYEYKYSDHHNVDEHQKLRTKRSNSPKIMGLSPPPQQQRHQQKQRSEVNYLSETPPSPPPPPSYHGPHVYEGGPYAMLRPPLSYMAEYYPPYHQSYPPSHMDIDNETGAGAGTDNADNKTSTAASVARRPSPPPPPQQTNYRYCPSLSGNDSSSINSNGCNYKYDDVIEVSGNNKNNDTNTNTNDFNIRQRLLEGRKSDSNDNNDSNNVFLSNAMSSNFSSDSSGNDSAPAAIKHPSTISGTNKRCKIDSSNKNATATAYDVTNIIAKKDGTVHNVRPVAVSYTQKRGNGGGGGGGGGVLSSSTSTTANHRQKKRKYQTFEDQLVQLADYKEKNGHCNVPQSFQGCRSKLGNWVCDMRTQYKKYKESKPSNMTNERISALEKLDFKWSKRHSFEDRLAQLADYKEKNGHCNVPQSFQGYGLGQWVDYQRKDYKKYKGSKPSNMKNERIRALEKLDFKWRIRTNFEDQLVQLADYKEKNGHCNVPQSFQGCRSKLGNWVSGMRTQYKKHKESKPSNMTNERVSALEKLDFKWQGNCGPAFRTLSLLAQQENDDNEVVAVARSVPTLEVPPTEVVIDVEKEDQIEREDDDQLFGDNTMTSSNNGDSDEDIGEDNVYRAEGDDHYYGNSDHDGGGWHDLGDDFHNSDDDSLVF